MDPNLETLQNQLSTARKEIKNLRQEIKSLLHIHQKDIQNMKDILTNFKCQNCRKQVDNRDTSTNAGSSTQVMDISVPVNAELVHFKPIGHIRSVFNEKRGVPRQPQLGTQLLGCIQLNPDLFTNPEHALQGLEDFSHIWIIYHFHKNAPHYKSKVAPPRLSGQKLGVFGTRSPHRPCPIGLSLVHIDKIENSCIYFYGTDMVDDTPVLDIKPYIPHYDTPSIFASGLPGNSARNSSFDRFGSREAPDGEETEFESNGGGGGGAAALPTTVKVPQWITDETKLNVTFHKNALTQINEIGVDRNSITEILQSDPRSVYLRTKHGSQIYTFQFGEITVTCKFDDQRASVEVLQVRKSLGMEELMSND